MSRRWAMLAIVFCTRLSMGFQFQSIAALTPFLVERFQWSYAQVGLLMGLYMLPGTIIAMPGGVLGRRFGSFRVTLTGLGLMVAWPWRSRRPGWCATSREIPGRRCSSGRCCWRRPSARWRSSGGSKPGRRGCRLDAMREPGQILLVACYELGHQPLAVAWPAAFLERAGYRPAVMDVSVEPFDADKVKRARVIAISVPMHTALRLGVRVAERARALNPGCHVCFFGLYASLNADHLFVHGADSVIGGEAESPLVDLIEALDNGAGGPPPSVQRPGRPAAPHLRRLDFPVPSRTALPSLKTYAHLDRQGRLEPAGYVEATRGCLHLCRHCPIPPVYGGRFFAVPRDVVLADIHQQYEAGARHITFGDPDFLNGPTHALAVARALHAEWPRLTFDVTAKIEHLLRHRARLPELADLGCLFIVSAAESLSDPVLAHLDKGHTRADIVEALRVTREAGITLRPTWVAFTPWTALGDYREWLDFLEAEALIDHVDPVQYGLRLLVPPGSLLLESPALAPHLGPLEPETLSYGWAHPDPRMDALQSQVAAAVAEAVERADDAPAIFDQVRALAAEAAGAAPPEPVTGRLAPDRRRPPRLSEAWFC